jgi:ABC-2 type transport system ATP-binding protein
MCSRAVLIDRGRIVADDTPAGLARRSEDGTLESAFARLTDQTEDETL